MYLKRKEIADNAAKEQEDRRQEVGHFSCQALSAFGKYWRARFLGCIETEFESQCLLKRYISQNHAYFGPEKMKT